MKLFGRIGRKKTSSVEDKRMQVIEPCKSVQCQQVVSQDEKEEKPKEVKVKHTTKPKETLSPRYEKSKLFEVLAVNTIIGKTYVILDYTNSMNKGNDVERFQESINKEKDAILTDKDMRHFLEKHKTEIIVKNFCRFLQSDMNYEESMLIIEKMMHYLEVELKRLKN